MPVNYADVEFSTHSSKIIRMFVLYLRFHYRYYCVIRILEF